ncbi:hypothetical protein E4U38_005520 [Claviceps purpurea]|nr:hypothetical protein E4U38_005520 [Claviceps purpurea]
MAMAYLLSNLLNYHRGIRIAENPVHSIYAIIIDHQLRQGSSVEASRVAREVAQMKIKPVIQALNWKQLGKQSGVRGSVGDPANLPNVETVARTLRYRTLGKVCRNLHVSSLFVAHHRDDDYETVLMRYKNGHSYRGCQGIPEANAIPECHHLHGVYQSGLLDDQMRARPFLSLKPPNKAMRHLRRLMKSELEAEEPLDKHSSCLGSNDYLNYFPLPSLLPGISLRDARDAHQSHVPYLAPLDCEEGGVMIYRPLLQFDKDRLIATCEANNIKWFEDPTNADATLTPRNAIRLTDQATLPPEWRKEAILDMARDVKRRVRLEEAEARRWLVRQAAILDFDPNAGTLLVELPPFHVANPQRSRPRLFAEARRAARRPHQRVIAAIAVRKLIEFVTPDTNVPPVADLGNVIDMLFPELAARKGQSPSKAFTIANVVFSPTVSRERIGARWHLSRAPYPSSKPLPERNLQTRHGQLVNSPLYGGSEESVGYPPRWEAFRAPALWDGRFWIRLSTCVPARLFLLPFQPQYAKRFREMLPPKQRARLERILRHYAPGKVRYTLPALYSCEGSYYDRNAKRVLTLLALPSLGIFTPGIQRWVMCKVRYRYVDLSLLGHGRRRLSRTALEGAKLRTRSVRKRKPQRLRRIREQQIQKQKQKQTASLYVRDVETTMPREPLQDTCLAL